MPFTWTDHQICVTVILENHSESDELPLDKHEAHCTTTSLLCPCQLLAGLSSHSPQLWRSRGLKWKGLQFSLSPFYIWSPGTGVNFSCIPAFPGTSCIKTKSQPKNRMILLLLDSWLKRIQSQIWRGKKKAKICSKGLITCYVLSHWVPISPFDSSYNADLHEWDEKELT